MHDIDNERFDRTVAQCWQSVEHRPKLPQHKNFVLAWLQKQKEKPRNRSMATLVEDMTALVEDMTTLVEDMSTVLEES